MRAGERCGSADEFLIVSQVDRSASRRAGSASKLEMAEIPDKICATCGRPFAWRKRWERVWVDVRHCSEACRRGKITTSGERFEQALVALLASRGELTSICPSEAARALSGRNFRSAMDPVRAAAFRLASRGVVRLTQGEAELRLDVVPRGPFRVRRGPSFAGALAGWTGSKG